MVKKYHNFFVDLKKYLVLIINNLGFSVNRILILDLHQYIATHADNLAILMKDSQACIDLLEAMPYNYKLKGSGPLSFHLGYGFHCDSTGTVCMDPGKYIDRMEEAYVQNFGIKPV